MVRLWDRRSMSIVKEINAHTEPVTSVCVCPTDDAKLLTNSRDNSLQLLDLRTYESLGTLRSKKIVASNAC
jgi:autophagy-related protein 16